MIASCDLSPITLGCSIPPACLKHRPGGAVSKSTTRTLAYHVSSAGVAQLVERRFCKADGVGSSPTSGLSLKGLLKVGPKLVNLLEPDA